jgi:flagellar basal-body rod protein FlgF
MDRMLYIAMGGAKEVMQKQAVVAHNLANASTDGFRAELNAFRATPVFGPGLHPTRAHVVETTVATDFSPGIVRHTGNDLDVAVSGRGWIAVQTPDGGEAYTRAGGLKTSVRGNLQTQAGFNVLGDGGPIVLPPDSNFTLARDGTVSAIPTSGALNAVIVVGRMKLVNPPDDQLKRGEDGLFRTTTPAVADANVQLNVGAVEGSNVNAAQTLVEMISAQRQYEMQLKLISEAEDNDQSANKLLGAAA